MCRCSSALSHVKDLRLLRNEEEEIRHEQSPYQQSNNDWASKLIQMLRMKSGQPYLTSNGSPRYGMNFLRPREASSMSAEPPTTHNSQEPSHPPTSDATGDTEGEQSVEPERVRAMPHTQSGEVSGVDSVASNDYNFTTNNAFGCRHPATTFSLSYRQ